MGYTYLASPYSHQSKAIRSERYHAVCWAAARLMAKGYVIFCPIAHTHQISIEADNSLDQDFWKRQDAPFVAGADALFILMLDGWKTSKGVQHEIDAFRAAGKPVEYIDPAEL